MGGGGGAGLGGRGGWGGCTVGGSGSSTKTASLALWLRRPPRERKIPGSSPACAGIFSESSHTSDLEISTPVATERSWESNPGPLLSRRTPYD